LVVGLGGFVSSTDGTCASGRHSDLLTQPKLADCISAFVMSDGQALE